MGILTSLKWKKQSKEKRGESGCIEEKLDGMIKWMQEMGPVLKEFAKISRL